MSSKLKNMTQKSKPEIKISFDGSESSTSIMTYSTLDTIQGQVLITSPYSTQLKNLSIEFIGTTKTFLERMSTSTVMSGRTEASHQFLKLSQPFTQDDLPTGNWLQAGRTYTFPFLFVVPEQLLPKVCRHDVHNEQIRQEHLKLPPSFGDKSLSKGGERSRDDFAPDMTRIGYAVTARLVEEQDGSDRFTVQKRSVRILPAVDEQPPITIDGSDKDYLLRSEKDVKKGLLKGKMGRLVLEIAQPKSIRLPALDSEDQPALSTMGTIMLRFDPAQVDSPPPRLGTLDSKLKISTFFASSARRDFPSRASMQHDLNQALHFETLSLPSRYMTGVEWTHHEYEDSEYLYRRSSAMSSSSTSQHSIPRPSEKYKGNGFYTAKILVPVTLPDDKAFVPTFHSCLISRVYSLSLHLGLHSATMAPSMTLKVPLQISAEQSTQARRSVSLAAEQLSSELEADYLLQSGVFGPVTEHVASRGSLAGALEMTYDDLLPEYEAMPRRHGMRVPLVR